MHIWKPIKGYEDRYKVSQKGAVFSLLNNIMLKTPPDGPGYPQVNLRKNGRTLHTTVHRLVAKAFVPNPHKKLCTNHKDGDKTNNRCGNIEWVTKGENNTHAHATGLMPDVEKSHLAKLTWSDVESIRKGYEHGSTEKELVKLYEVSRQTISRVINYKTWKCKNSRIEKREGSMYEKS